MKYVFNRRVFQTVSILIALIGFGYLAIYGLDTQVYINCPTDAIGGQCYNPMFNQCDEWYCETEILPAGFSYGQEPSLVYFLAFPLMLAVIVLGFTYNHLKYNKGYQ